MSGAAEGAEAAGRRGQSCGRRRHPSSIVTALIFLGLTSSYTSLVICDESSCPKKPLSMSATFLPPGIAWRGCGAWSILSFGAR